MRYSVYLNPKNNLMKNLFIITLLICLISCKTSNIQDQIIGKWEGLHDKSRCFEFKENGIYNEYWDGKNISEFSNFDSLTYEIKNDNKFPELIILEKNKNLYSRQMIQLENNQLIIATFKHDESKNIDHHIDELGLLIRKGETRRRNISNQKIKFIFPENYTGSSIIIYNESDGKKPVFDENGDKVYFIPQSGILKTNSSLGSDPFKIVKGEVEFYFEDEYNNLMQIDPFNPISILKESHINVKINGYNQIARYIVDDIINFHTNNNILFLTIDSTENLKNTRTFESFSKTFKSN